MKSKSFPLAVGLLLMILAVGAAYAQDEPAQKSAIDPEADAILQKMSDHMKDVESKVFRVTDTIDDVQEDGTKIQYAHVREFTVVRPDKLKVETTGDVSNRILFKDGKNLTVLDRDRNVYAQLPDPGTIDQAIDMLQEKYGMSLPAADLLTTDVYKVMTEGVDQISYIGKGYVGEEKCHHLLFNRKDIDWQLWISDTDKPSPRKILITYKAMTAQPQYTMQLLSSDDSKKVKDDVFAFEPPKDAQKIEFHASADSK